MKPNHVTALALVNTTGYATLSHDTTSAYISRYRGSPPCAAAPHSRLFSGGTRWRQYRSNHRLRLKPRRRTQAIRLLVAGLALIVVNSMVVSSVFAQTPSNRGLASSIDFDRQEYGWIEPIDLIFTLTNTSAEPLTVLKWTTPLAPVQSDLFVVLHDSGDPAVGVRRARTSGQRRSEDHHNQMTTLFCNLVR